MISFICKHPPITEINLVDIITFVLKNVEILIETKTLVISVDTAVDCKNTKANNTALQIQ